MRGNGGRCSMMHTDNIFAGCAIIYMALRAICNNLSDNATQVWCYQVK